MEKGEAKKRPGRKKGKHSKINKTLPFLGGNNRVFLLKTKKGKGKKNKNPNQKNNQKNK